MATKSLDNGLVNNIIPNPCNYNIWINCECDSIVMYSSRKVSLRYARMGKFSHSSISFIIYITNL